MAWPRSQEVTELSLALWVAWAAGYQAPPPNFFLYHSYNLAPRAGGMARSPQRKLARTGLKPGTPIAVLRERGMGKDVVDTQM